MKLKFYLLLLIPSLLSAQSFKPKLSYDTYKEKYDPQYRIYLYTSDIDDIFTKINKWKISKSSEVTFTKFEFKDGYSSNSFIINIEGHFNKTKNTKCHCIQHSKVTDTTINSDDLKITWGHQPRTFNSEISIYTSSNYNTIEGTFNSSIKGYGLTIDDPSQNKFRLNCIIPTLTLDFYSYIRKNVKHTQPPKKVQRYILVPIK